MPERLDWTPAADATILTMRAYGATWSTIGEKLGLSRNSVIERGRRINALGGPRNLTRPARPPVAEPNREPLAAGHPTAWSVLTEGTLLDGTLYVPLSARRLETSRLETSR